MSTRLGAGFFNLWKIQLMVSKKEVKQHVALKSMLYQDSYIYYLILSWGEKNSSLYLKYLVLLTLYLELKILI